MPKKGQLGVKHKVPKSEGRGRGSGEHHPSDVVPKNRCNWHIYDAIEVPAGVDVKNLTLEQQVQLVNIIRYTGRPNAIKAKIPMLTNWNIRLLSELAETDSDREVIQYLMYGWPANHDGRKVTVNTGNHSTADRYHRQVTEYIRKELGHKCLLGPFATLPWSENVAVSPMSTRTKKDSGKHRIIMDLSWPRNGEAVNDGISKDTYMGHKMALQYPNIDVLCKRAAQLGECRGYKRDLDRAFKQIPGCPYTWPLMGITWDGWYFFDKTVLMGCRSAPYVCQRITSFITKIMRRLQYFVANYVDDFMGLEPISKAWQSYQTLGNLLRDVGAQEAMEKAVPPSEVVEFLGVWFDLAKGTISITEERIQQLQNELDRWASKRRYYRTELESIIGKLQFVSNCVRPGRVMLARLRNVLVTTPLEGTSRVQEEMIQDLRWWKKFMRTYNGTSIMWMQQCKIVDSIVASDACLTAMGSRYKNRCIHKKFPNWLTTGEYKIHHLELVVVVTSLRVWKHELQGLRFVMLCDNEAVVHVVNSGYSRDRILQSWLRKLTFIAATGRFEVVLRYVPGVENRIPDILSRLHLNKKFKLQWEENKEDNWIMEELHDDVFQISEF